MPLLPRCVTYVRTFSSGKSVIATGENRGRVLLITNGTIPIHAEPSNVSSSSSRGTLAQRTRFDGPVREQQVEPRHEPHPRALRDGPGAVRIVPRFGVVGWR